MLADVKYGEVIGDSCGFHGRNSSHVSFNERCYGRLLSRFLYGTVPVPVRLAGHLQDGTEKTGKCKIGHIDLGRQRKGYAKSIDREMSNSIAPSQ